MAINIPVRYSPVGMEAEYTGDLEFPDHAGIWNDACAFVVAGNQARSMKEFWGLVREEYFRSGGGLRDGQPTYLEWD